MVTYAVHGVALMDPRRYWLHEPMITSKVAKWMVMQSEVDLHYIQQKSIKARVVPVFFTDLPSEEQRQETFNFFNEESQRRCVDNVL